MPRSVYPAQDSAADHLDAVVREHVDDLRYRLLVAGYRAGGEDDDVARAEGDLRPVGERHPVEGRHRLSLAAGGDESQPSGAVVLHLGDVDHRVGRALQIAQRGRRLDQRHHAPSGDGDLPAEFYRYVYDLFYSVNVG